ncbi:MULTISPECIES: PDR/VanB family oxidoreductase [Ramlibacter]|uniref:2Fe-2S iron-sulfur cluster binding domain-containing protein n=1 Tax=Ramlibacter pinisoli TaxID=2682844 RepID=A0A6N8IPS4_9BURK|nr:MULTISPECIES: PDR/VanB family oxidoreductase [Ramlibacter]MBA2960501.1 oxidoreductase [Ramlibacter sp. CGMCC 1.13660]MVQ27833.1 2Fe-2S iron-sulfur cluster binding domain-containing protein [Ramlibacter pinisoli]
MNEISVEVRSRTEEADGICSLELVHPGGELLPAFTAGAHIDVHVSPQLVRQYSLCNDPTERHHWRIAVLRDPASRGGSAGVHERLHAGTTLQVSAPRNHFELVAARRSVLVAGGIGITPILAMAQVLHATQQEFAMHYCARSERRMAFRREIQASGYAANVRFHAADGPTEQQFDPGQALAGGDAATHLYVCGPSGFMDHVLVTARALGWPEENLHREQFAAAPVATGEDLAFEVQLARSGRTCTVPAGRSALQVLLEQGVDIPFSCESGVCGTCITRVLDGEPAHRDSFFTDAERAANDQFTPCCSRSRTARLVLDL